MATKIKITAQGLYERNALPEHIGGGMIIIQWLRIGGWTLYAGTAPEVPKRWFDESFAGYNYWTAVNDLEDLRLRSLPGLQQAVANEAMGWRLINHKFQVTSSDPKTWVPELDMTLGSCLSRIGFRPDVLDLLW